MKISLNWIKEYVVSGVSTEQLIQRLTMSGTEAEKVERVGNDIIIEFEVTPNRADCLNMVGMAREIATVLNKPLSEPKIQTRKFPKQKCDIGIIATQGCSRYIGTVIKGVMIKPANKTIQSRLTILGNRLISNIVDITNYCLFELGQPMHAFDLDKLKGEKIIVRFAKKGEKITTLDGVERELDSSVLVIADAEKPVALAGIMGGANSEVTDQTKNILLESAYFDPILIRHTARKLGLASDSSYRFERGVVYETVETGARRAIDLILDSAGGTITQYADVAAGPKVKKRKAVLLDCDRMNAFLGATILTKEIKRILKGLGCVVQSGTKKGTLKVVPSYFRPDIKCPEDLYEEVARIVGYNNLPSTFPTIKQTVMCSNSQRAKRLQITDYLLSQGFNEVLTYSLLSSELISAANTDKFSHMSVLNPLSKEQEFLRPHMLPSLLQVAHTNINRGQKDLAFFETGKIYPHGGEKEVLGILMTGMLRQDWRRSEEWPFDFFDLKGSVEKMLCQFGLSAISFCVSGEDFLEEGQRADIFNGKTKIGTCGKVANTVVENFNIKQASDVFLAQIDLERLYVMSTPKKKYIPIFEYPAISRDISLAIDKTIALEKVYAIVKECGSEHLKSIDFKEEYLGEKIPQGQRGLVFSVMYQSSKRTLIENDIQSVHEQMCREIEARLNATIR